MSNQSALSNVRFDSWDIDSNVLSALSEKGWECATQIQAEAIPLARKGLNVVGQARTGSGKTAAFGIPCIESTESNGITQAIIITPTPISIYNHGCPTSLKHGISNFVITFLWNYFVFISKAFNKLKPFAVTFCI